jgi:hypothetical protein
MGGFFSQVDKTIDAVQYNSYFQQVFVGLNEVYKLICVGKKTVLSSFNVLSIKKTHTQNHHLLLKAPPTATGRYHRKLRIPLRLSMS